MTHKVLVLIGLVLFMPATLDVMGDELVLSRDFRISGASRMPASCAGCRHAL